MSDRKAEQIFYEKYGREPDGVAFTPYRVCPIGAHVDHNFGRITGLAIDKGIRIAYGIKHNGVVEVSSCQFAKRAQWHIAATPERKQDDWADHLRGATLALLRRHPLQYGMCAVVDGELPIGGLSSSAAVILSFLTALCRINGIRLTDHELILTAQEAENRYVGVACGKLDQSCEVLCRKDRLLYLDTLDDSFERIEAGAGMPEWAIGIFFSGLERSLAGSRFNMRVDEAKAAAYALMGYAGMEYGKFEEADLRSVPREVFERYGDRLPENWRRRAAHWYTENDRVIAGAEAWRRGDLVRYGQLSFESGRSSIGQWETGSPELKRLYEILLDTPGVYGGRFSGAGFKGCCMALIEPGRQEEILDRVRREYLKTFPALAEKYRDAVCRSTDGVGSDE